MDNCHFKSLFSKPFFQVSIKNQLRSAQDMVSCFVKCKVCVWITAKPQRTCLNVFWFWPKIQCGNTQMLLCFLYFTLYSLNHLLQIAPMLSIMSPLPGTFGPSPPPLPKCLLLTALDALNPMPPPHPNAMRTPPHEAAFPRCLGQAGPGGLDRHSNSGGHTRH